MSETDAIIAPEDGYEVKTSRTKIFNVVILGLSFMLIFTAFQSTGMMEQNVIDSRKNETNGTYKGDAFLSQSVIYAVFSLCNWVAPSIVYMLGAKLSMVLGAITYCLFVVSWIEPWTWSLYVTSVLVGFGAAVLWTAQGNALTVNSSQDTMTRNTGIFWGLFQFSLVLGNLFEFFELRGEDYFSVSRRHIIFIVFTIVCCLGTLMLLLIRPVTNASIALAEILPEKHSFVDGFRNSWNLFLTKEMALLSVVFGYTGIVLTYWSSIYTTCVGHNLWLGVDAKSMIGLTGVAIGVGEFAGGGLFGILGKRMTPYGRDPIVVLAFVLHTIAFYMSYINLPNNCPKDDSMEYYWISSSISASKGIIITNGVLLGFADAIYNTQIISLMGTIYAADSAPAFALYKFMQSLFAAVGFFYSDHFTLQVQLAILVVCNTLACFAFVLVERLTRGRILQIPTPSNPALVNPE